MIFDIERLIKAADYRDDRIRSEFSDRIDKIDEQIHRLTTQAEDGRREMLVRAEKLVATLRERPISANELNTWFAGKRGALLTAAPVSLRSLQIQRERLIEKQKMEARIGEVQEELRMMLDQGKTQVSETALRGLGYWNDFPTWMSRYNAAQRGSRVT